MRCKALGGVNWHQAGLEAVQKLTCTPGLVLRPSRAPQGSLWATLLIHGWKCACKFDSFSCKSVAGMLRTSRPCLTTSSHFLRICFLSFFILPVERRGLRPADFCRGLTGLTMEKPERSPSSKDCSEVPQALLNRISARTRPTNQQSQSTAAANNNNKVQTKTAAPLQHIFFLCLYKGVETKSAAKPLFFDHSPENNQPTSTSASSSSSSSGGSIRSAKPL